MASRTTGRDAQMSAQIKMLHVAVTDIAAVMNQPLRYANMVREAGISLDRALFPLLVGIERRGPIGVVDLADRVGRDYTTVSRQVARLESLGLVSRQAGAADRRVREATITPKGKAMTDAVDMARERIGRAVFADWDKDDVEQLVRLVRRFADVVGQDIAVEDTAAA